MGRFAVVALLLAFFLQGCWGIERRIENREQEKEAAWRADHPVPEQPTKELVQQWWTEAKAEVMAEVAKERTELGDHATGALSSIFTGNWIALAFHAIGAAGIALGINAKLKKPAVEGAAV